MSAKTSAARPVAWPLESASPGNAHVHLAGLDLLRFGAACAVMLFHFTVLAWAMPDSTAFRVSASGGGHAAFPELAPWTNIGWVGVQVFFVISGFVIAYSAEGATLGSFLRSRALRLLPAAWVCASITFLASHGQPGPHVMDYLRSLVISPVGPWVDPVYWTLGIEVAFYALVALVIAGGGAARLHYLALLLGAFSAGYWLLFWLSQAGMMPDWPAAGRWWLDHQEDRRLQLLLLPYGGFFALGVYLRRYVRVPDAADVAPVCMLLAMVCIAQIIAYNDVVNTKTGIESPAAYAVGVWSLALAGMVMAIAWRGDASPRVRSALRQIGLMTYPLYLVHQVLGCLLLGVLSGLGMPRWIALGCVVVAMLCLSLIISAGIEPALRRGLARVLAGLASQARIALLRPGQRVALQPANAPEESR